MPAGVQLLLPPGLALVAALVTWFAGAVGLRLGRWPAALSAWLAGAVVVGLWVPARSVQELHGPALGMGASLGLRLDAVSFIFAVAVLVPAALLLTFQHRGWREGGAAALTLAAVLMAVLADGIVLKALFTGSAATVLLVQLRSEHQRGTEAFWPAVIAGWLCLAWFGATLEVISQTSVYTAVPVTALGTPAFLLLAASALLVGGLVPWRPWTSEMWDRPRLTSGALAVALLMPLGLALLVRAYELGGGHWPSIWANLALAVLGVAVAATSAARAQQADTRRAHQAETAPGLGGVALVAFALGTPAGMVAGLTCVLAGALVAGLLPLMPDRAGRGPAAALALAAGVPPALTFVARLLTIQAAIEAGDAWAFLGIALALSWLVKAAASARALRLPAMGRGAEAGGSPVGAAIAGAAVLLGGVFAGVLTTYVSLPATAEVMTFPVAAVAGGSQLVATASGAWASVALGGPAAVLLLGIAAAARFRPPPTDEGIRGQGAVAPLLAVPWRGYPERWIDWALGLRIPDEYRSLADPKTVEAAMARGQPVLWVVLLLVLAAAVNR